MKKNFKKAVALLCAITLALPLAACGGKNDTEKRDPTKIGYETPEDSPVTEPGTLPIVTEPVTLKVLMVNQTNNIDYSPENNKVLQWIMEQTGVNLDIEVVSHMDAVTRQQTGLASGEYPDIYWGANFTAADMATYGVQEQIFIPLNGLIENYSYWFTECMEEMPDLLKVNTQEDGYIYGIPNTEISYHTTYPKKLWLNHDWLDKLGLSVPETTDELYNVLKAFKTQDPNGNGINDEIPLTGSTGGWYNDPCDYILNAFLPYNGGLFSEISDYTKYLYNDNGTIRCSGVMEEYREGLRYMNKLYSEGLLDKATFTQTSEDVIRVSSQDEKVYGGYAAGHLGVVMDYTVEGNEDPFEAIAPVEGPNGRRAAFYSPQGVATGAMFAITDKCEYPEVAWRFFDFLYSWEATINSRVGMEGIAWERLPEDTDLLTHDGNKARAIMLPEGTFEEHSLLNDRLYMRPCNMGRKTEYDTFAVTKPASEWTHMDNIVLVLGKYTDRYAEYGDVDSAIKSISYSVSEAQELSQLLTALLSYMQNCRVQFITGGMSLDDDWDTYLDTVSSAGLDRVLEIVQDGYDRMWAE